MSTNPDEFESLEAFVLRTCDKLRYGDTDRQGHVNNAVFAKDGQLLAVIVVPSGVVGRGGPMAYPFYGYESGWAPGDSSFEVPYSDQERNQLPPFNFQRFQGFWSGQGNRN